MCEMLVFELFTQTIRPIVEKSVRIEGAHCCCMEVILALNSLKVLVNFNTQTLFIEQTSWNVKIVRTSVSSRMLWGVRYLEGWLSQR